MANKKTETFEIETLKPETVGTVEPQFIVEEIKGSRRNTGDVVMVRLRPQTKSAQPFGTVSIRFPIDLTPNSALWNFALLMGEKPAKGVNPNNWAGRSLTLALSATAPETE